MCARARASAVPPRTTGRAASKLQPSASAIVRAAGPEAANTEYNEVTRAVFHAPMFALKADAELNACAPKPHAVHADGKGSHGLGFRVLGRARSTSPPTRAHTQPIHHPSHTGARIHNPDRFSQIQVKWIMYVYIRV